MSDEPYLTHPIINTYYINKSINGVISNGGVVGLV